MGRGARASWSSWAWRRRSTPPSTPRPGLNMATVVVFVGLLIGLCLVVLSEGVPVARSTPAATGCRAPMRALPGSLVVALVVVGAVPPDPLPPRLRLRGRRRLLRGRRARAAATRAGWRRPSVLSILAVSIVAWVAWAPVSEMASDGQPEPGHRRSWRRRWRARSWSAWRPASSCPCRSGSSTAATWPRWNKWAWAGMFAARRSSPSSTSCSASGPAHAGHRGRPARW